MVASIDERSISPVADGHERLPFDGLAQVGPGVIEEHPHAGNECRHQTRATGHRAHLGGPRSSRIEVADLDIDRNLWGDPRLVLGQLRCGGIGRRGFQARRSVA